MNDGSISRQVGTHYHYLKVCDPRTAMRGVVIPASLLIFAFSFSLSQHSLRPRVGELFIDGSSI
jgi:hypothetical protein